MIDQSFVRASRNFLREFLQTENSHCSDEREREREREDRVENCANAVFVFSVENFFWDTLHLCIWSCWYFSRIKSIWLFERNENTNFWQNLKGLRRRLTTWFTSGSHFSLFTTPGSQLNFAGGCGGRGRNGERRSRGWGSGGKRTEWSLRAKPCTGHYKIYKQIN